MADLIERVCELVVTNNKAILSKSGSGTTAIMSIAIDVRKVTDNLDSSLPKKFFARAQEAIEKFMEDNIAIQFRQRKGNRRDLFNFAAEINRPLNSIEAAVRFTFLALDRIAPRYGTMTIEDVPYASLRATFEDIKSDLFESLIARMNEMRDGDALSRDAIRSVVDLIRKINRQQDKSTQSSTAERLFANVYCKAVNEYYIVKGAEKLAASDNVVAYANWAGRRINEERELLSELSMADQWDKLKDSLHTALVRDGFISVVHDTNGGLAKELTCGRDVSDLFALLELVSTEKDPQEGVREVSKAYQAFTESRVNAILNTPAPPEEPTADGKPKKKGPSQDTLNFAEFMEFAFQHFRVLWPKQFKSNVAVGNAFEAGVHNAFKGRQQIPKNLSDYINEYFTKTLQEEELSADVLLTLFVFKRLFSCLVSRDEFLPHHKARLAQRIIKANFKRAAENALLVDLKAVIGNADIHSFTAMIQDVDSSVQLSKTFSETILDKECRVKTNFILITSHYWPSLERVPLKFDFFPSLQSILTQFERYFLHRYVNRKIDWVVNNSKATLNISFPGGPKEVSAALSQIVVLLTIDGTTGLSAKQISEVCGLPLDNARDAVASIATMPMFRFAKQVDPTTKKAIDLATVRPRITNDFPLFAVNEQFKAQTRKIEVPPPQQSRNANPVETEKLNDHRRIRTQVAIVRYMKSRGTSSYADMVEAVIKDLRQLFDAQPPVVKQVLDDLIEKDYVKRDEKDRTRLIYIS